MRLLRPQSPSLRVRLLLLAGAVIAAVLLVVTLLSRKDPDLVVYGATPQGIMAAVTAARQGERVLLIEPTPGIGGVLTQAWLATLDLSVDARGRPLAQGLFRKFFDALKHDNSFDVLHAQRVLTDLLTSSRVKVELNTHIVEVHAAAGKIISLRLNGPNGATTLQPENIIDATDMGDLAVRSGARFTLGRSDTGLDHAQMAATLVFRMTGLDWKVLKEQERHERRRTNPRGRSLFGLASFTSGYHPSDTSRFFLRGFNAALQDDGSILVNALLIYGVDGTSLASLQQAHLDGAREAVRVVAYLRHSFPTVFGRATLGGVAPQLYIRESRHLIGDARLSAADVLYGRHFRDAVGVNAYPLDGQSYLPGQKPFLLGTPRAYEVPLGALVPAGFKNLLVVSQASSFASVAAFSTRVVPLQMTLGEAAGQASVLAHWAHLDYPTIDHSPLWMELLQVVLRAHRVRVNAPSGPMAGHCQDAISSEQVQAETLLSASLLSAPYYYVGCLYLNAPETTTNFVNDLQHGLETRTTSSTSRHRVFEDLQRQYGSSLRPLTLGTARLILQRLDLQSDGLLDLRSLPAGTVLTRSEVVRLRWTLLERMRAAARPSAVERGSTYPTPLGVSQAANW